MTFRVETSAQAEVDASAILEWLLAQHAGDAGLHWFLLLDGAIASLANAPERCPTAPESTQFPFEVRQLLYAASLTCTGFFSLLKATEGSHPSHRHGSPETSERAPLGPDWPKILCFEMRRAPHHSHFLLT